MVKLVTRHIVTIAALALTGSAFAQDPQPPYSGEMTPEEREAAQNARRAEREGHE